MHNCLKQHKYIIHFNKYYILKVKILLEMCGAGFFSLITIYIFAGGHILFLEWAMIQPKFSSHFSFYRCSEKAFSHK